jgi:prepilin-type N-terminal cleavage/methylation domain-containing protein
MRRQAYTLVEVLAVTVLLGLIAGLASPSLLRAVTGDPLRRAADRLALAYRDVRAQAFGRHLSLELEPWGFSATSHAGGQRVALPSTRLPEVIQVSWIRDGRSVHLVDIDPRGHGPDLDVAVLQDARELRYTVDGLTGQWTSRALP